jgi:site-specific DNA-methyltransferase (adenine-specific)
MRTGIIHNQPAGTLTSVADASIHVAVLSAPYNKSYSHQESKDFNLNGYDGFDDSVPEEQYQAEQVALLNALGRVLAPDGSVFYVHKDRRVNGRLITPQEWIAKAEGLRPWQVIVWNRGSTWNHASGQLYPITEYVFWLARPDCNPRFDQAATGWTQVWAISPHDETGRNSHPAPFPLALPLRCILMTAPRPGDIVLDCYMGSGTTAVAATLLGLPWVGYETSPRYVGLAKDRVASALERWRNPGAGPASWEKKRPPRRVA